MLRSFHITMVLLVVGSVALLAFKKYPGTDSDTGLKSIKIVVADSILSPGAKTTLKVLAVKTDGSSTDVTKACYFETQDKDILSYENGTLSAKSYGEAVICARYGKQYFAMVKVRIPQKLTVPFPVQNEKTEIDRLVNLKLHELGFPPSAICTDETFVRRVYLNLTGRLPSPEAAKKFLSGKNSNKRAELIDQLLASAEFTEFQVLKWGDLLRIKSEFPSNLWPNAVQTYNRWLTESFRDNMPYDKFVRELLVSSGSNFRSPQANFYRAFQKRDPKIISESAGLLFLGTRYECARCHAHPKTDLVRTDYNEMGQFFTQLRYKKTDEWKEEIVYVETDVKPNVNKVSMPDGKEVELLPNTDLRQAYADWLTAKDNPLFARVMVNRIWYWLMGKGIVHEPDDFRDTNPPSNPALLQYLEKEFISHDYDLKHIFRLILNSSAFQRSSVSNDYNKPDKTWFSHYPLRRLTAEQLVDAICDVTGVPEKYMSKVPEPFTFLPSDFRAVQLKDGTISTPFLEMFGRPSRDVSYESDRNNDLTMKQALFLLNSSQIQDKIKTSSKLKKLVNSQPDNQKLIREVFLTVLSRYPAQNELSVAERYFNNQNNRGNSANDLVWALINTKEFIFNK